MSLFNTIAADSESMAEQDAAMEAPDATGGTEPAWWIDSSTPGNGDRPEWLPEKYKSAEDVAKAYRELQSKLGTAPEEYDWSKGDGWIDLEYEPFQKMAEVAKSKRVPQEVMDTMLESVGKYLDEFKVDYNEEKAKLGDNAEERLRLLSNWAKSNFSEKAFSALTENMKTAEAVMAIEEIRQKMMDNRTTIPTGNEVMGEGQLTMEEVQQELTDNWKKYKEDPVYRKAMQAKFEKVSSQADFVDKSY